MNITYMHALSLSLSLTHTHTHNRSVQDELKRESYSDAFTVALSYLAMLVYISFALGSLPARGRPMDILVLR
jgi:Niemann-Pick C1 protein